MTSSQSETFQTWAEMFEDNFGEDAEQYLTILRDAEDAIAIWDSAGMTGWAEAVQRLESAARDEDNPTAQRWLRKVAHELNEEA